MATSKNAKKSYDIGHEIKEINDMTQIVAKDISKIYTHFGADGKNMTESERAQEAGNVVLYMQWLKQKTEQAVKEVEKMTGGGVPRG